MALRPIKFLNIEVRDERGDPTEDTLQVSDDTYALVLTIRDLISTIRRNNG
mgnify:CR=1 FL=1|jgi:hypothetical protein|tara:strand:+ start:931 stop:1083 length:153 start_codon:yes stop_codon:yes gene_type:complete